MPSDTSNKVSSPPENNQHDTRSTRSTSGSSTQWLINHEHITDGTHGRPNAPFLQPHPRNTLRQPQVHTPPPSTSPKSASSQNSYGVLSTDDTDHDSNNNVVPVNSYPANSSIGN